MAIKSSRTQERLVQDIDTVGRSEHDHCLVPIKTIQFHQQRLPETLQKNGGFIPGYRPGQQTATYLTRVVNRVTSVGALFLGAVALLPYVGRLLLNTPVNLTISATALLIIVGVVIDTMRQLEAQLMMRNYQSFIK